jgi:transposase
MNNNIIIKKLIEQNRLQAEYIRLLKTKIAELERRLNIDSNTSSKPPSSDGLRKKPCRTKSSRESKKNRGGQKGHKGNTLKQVDNPSETIIYSPKLCDTCGDDLSGVKVKKIRRRQVFDVEIVQQVTEHQSHVKQCSCGKINVGTFPEQVKAPVQIGSRLRSIATYLSMQFIPKDRLSEVMKDVFGISVSDTSLLKHEEHLAKNLIPFYDQTLESLKVSSVSHIDETGIRVKGKTQWMHVLSNEKATYLWHNVRRKSLLTDLTGVLVHDHYAPYYQYESVVHAFCNAHHLRELKALIEYEKEDWARNMNVFLRRLCRIKNRYGVIDNNTKKKVFRIYDKIIQQGFAYHFSLPPLHSPDKVPRKRGRKKKRIGHNLLIRLSTHREGVLLFLSDPEVPFTNNQAERDLRMVKIKQKVSGCFRTFEGVQSFAVLRSFISTVKKNGHNVLESIQKALVQTMQLHNILNTPRALPFS